MSGYFYCLVSDTSFTAAGSNKTDVVTEVAWAMQLKNASRQKCSFQLTVLTTANDIISRETSNLLFSVTWSHARESWRHIPVQWVAVCHNQHTLLRDTTQGCMLGFLTSNIRRFYHTFCLFKSWKLYIILWLDLIFGTSCYCTVMSSSATRIRNNQSCGET